MNIGCYWSLVVASQLPVIVSLSAVVASQWPSVASQWLVASQSPIVASQSPVNDFALLIIISVIVMHQYITATSLYVKKYIAINPLWFWFDRWPTVQKPNILNLQYYENWICFCCICFFYKKLNLDSDFYITANMSF